MSSKVYKTTDSTNLFSIELLNIKISKQGHYNTCITLPCMYENKGSKYLIARDKCDMKGSDNVKVMNAIICKF